MTEVRDHSGELAGQPVFWREAEPAGGAPTLYLHGVPSSSDDWMAFLERTGGIAPDLPGFGRSGKRGDLDFSIAGYDHWLEAFLDERGIDRFGLVVHDFGAVGLALAQRFPQRVERLVILNTLPLLAGYRWHRYARAWRLPVVGEVAMGLITRPTLRLISREFNAAPGPMPQAWQDAVLAHFDQGTQRAILRLYRSTPASSLGPAGARLGDLTCPALVVWGDRDPFLAGTWADAYAAALGGEAQVLHLPDAGHWPWLDRPDVVDAVAAFLNRP